MEDSAEKVYRTRPHRVLANLVFGIAGAVFAGALSGIWLQTPWTFGVGAAVFLLYLWLVIFDNMISVHISGNQMTVWKGGKVIHHFAIDKCAFHAKTTSSVGDTECRLTVITPDGQKTLLDCELIGVTKFYELLEDVGVVGEKAGVIEIETLKK